MAGLIDQAQQPAPTAAEGEEIPAEGGEESNLSPEEQEAYDSAMKMVGEMIYNNDESNQAILDMLQPDALAVTIADATAFLISKIEETFQGNYLRP